MKFLHLLVFVGLCEAYPKSRRHVGSQGTNVVHPQIVGSADPALAGRPVAARFRSVPSVRQVNPNVRQVNPNVRQVNPNVRQVNAPTDRVDMFGTVGALNPPNRPAYTHSQGALEVTGGIVNIRGGMVNAVGGVVNVVGARINRIPAPVYSSNKQPTYGVRTSGQGRDGRRIGTLSLNENQGIVNGNDSTVTIVGGTVNLFEGYSVNDPNLPAAFTTTMNTQAGIAVDATQQPVTVAAQTSVPTVTTTPPPTTTTVPTTTAAPNTTTTAPTTTPEPTTLSPVDAWYLEGCQDAFARAEIFVTVSGFGPLDDNCGTYVKCEQVAGKIVATYTTCPGQQWFTNATGICGVPDGDICPWSPCNGVVALFVPDPATCYGFFECEGGAAQFSSCPPGYLFSNRTYKCHPDVLNSCPQTTSIPPGEMADYMADLYEASLIGGPLRVGPGPGAAGAEGGGGRGCVTVGEGQYRNNGVLMACLGGMELDPVSCSCV